jgi:hypothetical protein
MLNTLDHQGNANQNDIDILSNPTVATIDKKKNAGENVGKKEHFYNVGGNVN